MEPVKQPTLTASQRIERAEANISNLASNLAMLMQSHDVLKQAVSLLSRKLSALMSAISDGKPATDEVLDQIMLETKVAELKSKIDDLVVKGLLVSDDTVGDDSFLVCREYDASGKVLVERQQFVFSSMPDEKQKALLKGRLTGEKVEFGDNHVVEIVECYKIVEQKPAAALEAPAEQPAEASAVEVAATEATEVAPNAETPSSLAPDADAPNYEASDSASA